MSLLFQVGVVLIRRVFNASVRSQECGPGSVRGRSSMPFVSLTGMGLLKRMESSD